MTDHADTIRRVNELLRSLGNKKAADHADIAVDALEANAQKAARDRDRWAGEVESMRAERQQAIDERDAALRKAALYDMAMKRADEYRAQMSDMSTRLIQQRRRLAELEEGRGRTVREAEARCEQAIDERDKWAREAISVQGDIVKLSEAYKELKALLEMYGWLYKRGQRQEPFAS